MKKLIFMILLSAAMLFTFTACDLPFGTSSSGSADKEISAADADASATDAAPASVSSPAQPAGDGETQQAVTYTWGEVGNDTQYRAEVRKRLDEFSDLLIRLSSLEKKLGGTAPEKLAGNSDYKTVRDCVSSWTSMIDSFPSGGVPAGCEEIYARLSELSQQMSGYIGEYPIYVSKTGTEKEETALNEMMDTVIWLNDAI